MAPINGEPIRGEREGSAAKDACRMEEGAAAEARPPSASKPYERMFGIVKDFQVIRGELNLDVMVAGQSSIVLYILAR
jgi:hypothetical protein